ncbi:MULTISPECIES: hypothetical protein [Nostocales]|jgi:hypothetical protein|uniref:Uncharacterized protein n=1 Tax=Dolichospermum flos-aquae UHCC 0037 TaxID=2590026 RepID=A0ACC7S220_DOLFA|nr:MULTISPECIES: hypothetical protein [Nostocales]ALB40506.1 hypothetical protein AA650_08495 [Anabaena sp. WA102]MBO1063986.1 hypothetical protein [Anabaena sp. 54]MTJ41854.1 hypothetical protein [Dolichospermum flos-aquae UHCC 0037]OBQ19631.1 MAG: hypothetical protein AN486_08705 [Anabaena sp. AL93]
MKILSQIFDNRIKAYNILTEISISEYLEIAKIILQNNPFQRKRLRSYSSIYNLLKKDLKVGCTIPPLVLALGNENIEINYEDDNESLNYINNHKNKLIILDGLQRTYTLLDVEKELDFENDENKRNFYDHKLRFEIYLGLNKIGILYRMLTLNTGQSPMSVRHQIEILYSNYLDENIPGGIRLLREVEEETPHQIGEYRFNDVIDGFTSYILRDESSLDRRDLLESIKSLEKLALENQDNDLFQNYLITYNNLVKKIHELAGDWNCNNEEIILSGKPFGSSVDKIFSKSQVMTGFGAAVGFLKDKNLINSFDDINRGIADIKPSKDDYNFLDELIRKLDEISKTAKKIGNSQRMYFYYLFRELFSSASDSFLLIDESIESSYKRYKLNE